MKTAFENILKAIKPLSDKNQEYIIKQLKEINNNITGLQLKNDSFKSQLAGINPKLFNDYLIKSIEMLKLFGFNENTWAGFNPSFLGWFIENTITITKYNPKFMNFYLLSSMQQAYFITMADNGGNRPTYNEVKKTLLTFDETIAEYEKQTKQSLIELIEKLDGKN